MGVKAQSTSGWGKTFLPENMCMKMNKILEFYMIIAHKYPPKFWEFSPAPPRLLRL